MLDLFHHHHLHNSPVACVYNAPSGFSINWKLPGSPFSWACLPLTAISPRMPSTVSNLRPLSLLSSSTIGKRHTGWRRLKLVGERQLSYCFWSESPGRWTHSRHKLCSNTRLVHLFSQYFLASCRMTGMTAVLNRDHQHYLLPTKNFRNIMMAKALPPSTSFNFRHESAVFFPSSKHKFVQTHCSLKTDIANNGKMLVKIKRDNLRQSSTNSLDTLVHKGYTRIKFHLSAFRITRHPLRVSQSFWVALRIHVYCIPTEPSTHFPPLVLYIPLSRKTIIYFKQIAQLHCGLYREILAIN